jgi:hypothetical protein
VEVNACAQICGSEFRRAIDTAAGQKEESRIDRCSHLSVSSARSGSLRDLHPRMDASVRLKTPRVASADSAIWKKLSAGRLRLLAVMLDVVLRRFRGVMRRVV